MLIKYSGKYIEIYFNLEITFYFVDIEAVTECSYCCSCSPKQNFVCYIPVLYLLVYRGPFFFFFFSLSLQGKKFEDYPGPNTTISLVIG